MCVCTDPQELAANLDGFQKVFTKFLADRRVGNSIHWDKIQPPLKDSVISYPRVDVPRGEAKVLLDKLVVLKLNGRLGTSMGCVDPKVSSRSGATTRFWTWQSNKLRYGCVCVSVRCFGMCVLVCVSVVFVCECGSRLFFFCVCVLCVSVFCLCVLVSVRFMGLLFKYYILASN